MLRMFITGLIALWLVTSCNNNMKGYGRMIMNQVDEPCEEIYTVEEGETLQTISEKCNAPFILMDNPHIQDTDDLSQGLVLKITSLDNQ
ncbi:hypothetical protein SUGI_1201920 [Cryptomeria japonica]|nr:hypothetical protein SUGI_1201920 [Cryptomeria japonica]